MITAAIVLTYTLKGFIKSVLGSSKILLAFIIALIFAKPVGGWISESFLFEPINNSIFSSLSNMLSQAESQINIEGLVAKLPAWVLAFFENVGLSIESIVLDECGSLLTNDNIIAISASIAGVVSSIISTAIAFISVFVISMIALIIVVFFLDKLFKAPILNKLNKALGFAFGIITAFIALTVISAALTLVLNIMSAGNPEISAEIIKDKTIVYKLISSINVISWFF
jgi:uncharacterized membrane protein required for colicin V production